MANIIYKNRAKMTYYGSEQFDLLIVCPHGCLGEEFFNEFSEILDYMILSEKELKRYMKIEVDFGTSELGNKIGLDCFDKLNLNVLVIEPEFPRSILDAGRVYPQCFRGLIDYSENKELHLTFKKIHDDYTAYLFELLHDLNDRNGIAIDLHTMSPCSPATSKESYTEAIDLHYDNAKEYLDLFETSHLNGEKRKSQMMVQDVNKIVFSDKKLTRIIAREFLKIGHSMSFDYPYVVGPHMMGYYLMKKTKSICIDIPKTMLSTADIYDEDYCLSNLHVCEKKLQILSDLFVKSISERNLSTIK